MTETQCKQCGGTIHPYECGSDGCCGECNYHAALTSSAAMTERGSIAYANDFDRRYYRNWDHRAYAFDEHCRTAGVKDRRSLLPGRWAA